MKSKKVQNIIIIIFFAGFVGLVAFNQAFKVTKRTDLGENRQLSEKPKLDVQKLDAYPKKYETYLNDNFGLRVPFVRFMNYLSKSVFQKSTLKGFCFIGIDDYVFEKRNNLPFFLGEKYFSEEQLSKLKVEFTKREEYFAERNIKPYILICPSKHSVHTEKMPVFLRNGGFKITDQFINVIQNHTNIPIIDGREVLKKKKKNHLVYQKYDTHWNRQGAFFCVQELVSEINNDFQHIPFLGLSDFKVDTFTNRSGNFQSVLGNAEDYQEPGFDFLLPGDSIYKVDGFEHQKTSDFPYSQKGYYNRMSSSLATDSLPRVVVFRDSYANFAFDYMPYYFSETLYIWDNWKYMVNEEILEIEKPDIVIYMIFEGFLHRVLFGPSFVEVETDDKKLQ